MVESHKILQHHFLTSVHFLPPILTIPPRPPTQAKAEMYETLMHQRLLGFLFSAGFKSLIKICVLKKCQIRSQLLSLIQFSVRYLLNYDLPQAVEKVQ